MSTTEIMQFVAVARLQYDNVTRKTSNQPGVQIRQPDFGNTSTVEWLDESHLSYSAYFISCFLTYGIIFLCSFCWLCHSEHVG